MSPFKLIHEEIKIRCKISLFMLSDKIATVVELSSGEIV